jgi:segregation and condensation protein A
MATWLAYLKSKLLLPGSPEEEFAVNEVAEKLKLQLKKLELIRLLSDQMLKRKRLGREIRTRGMKAGIKPIYNSLGNLVFEVFGHNYSRISLKQIKQCYF